MLTVALRGLRANWARFAATLLAIVAGVGFFAAGRMLTDSMEASLGGEIDRQYAAVAAAVAPALDTDDVSGSAAQIPPSVLDAVQAVPAVEAAAGELTGDVGVLEPDGRPLTDDMRGRLWVTVPALNPQEVVAGRAPAADGEAALDEDSAGELGVDVGDQVRLATSIGEVPATLVGITRFGSEETRDPGGTVSLSEASAFRLVNSGVEAYTRILVAGPTSGPAQEALVADLADAVPAGFEVLSHEQFLEQQKGAVTAFADLLRPALTFFALLALFVCGFVIFNTFSVIVAQRVRELGLLRAVGATPRQVRRSLQVEGLLVGLAGSVLGILAGALFALALQGVLGASGIELPGAGVRLTVRTVVYALLAGTLITVVSVLLPAVKAGRTAPVEALRASAVDTSGTSRLRLVVSLVLLGVGGAALLVGAFARQALPLAGGGFVFAVGVIVAGPVLAGAFARVTAVPLRAFGVSGRLADDNTVRNPRRTAITANALVIGVLLVTLVTTAGGTLRDWLVLQVNRLTSADFVITSAGGGIDAGVLQEISDVPGVTTVAPVTVASALVDGEASTVSAGDLSELETAAGVAAAEGDLAGLADGGIAVSPLGPAGPGDVEVGDTVAVAQPGGGIRRLPVVAVLEIRIDTLALQNLVAPATFAELFGQVPPQDAYVKVSSGEVSQVRDTLDDLLAPFANLTVVEGNFIGQLIGSVFDFLIAAVNALLGMSVVIALIGIVNTLSLSIHERRREIGLLRAVGMTPAEVRRMVRLESLLIALLGTLTGLLSGLFLAWCATRAAGLTDAGFSWSWPTLALLVAAGVVVGLLASLAPTWRASRIDVLDALATT